MEQKVALMCVSMSMLALGGLLTPLVISVSYTRIVKDWIHHAPPAPVVKESAVRVQEVRLI